jgi:4-hydroxybenzoate polyprenyltransferase
MVTTFRNIIAFGRLVRFPNLIIIVLTQCLVRWFIIRPLLDVKGLSLQMNLLLFILLVLATVLVTAGGYAINDYFDRKIDTVNNPDDVIVGRFIPLRHTMVIHMSVTIAGVLIGLYVAWAIGFLYLGFLFILGSGILWFYSTTYKRQAIVGNVIVALITGMIPMLVLLFELPVLYKNYIHLLLADNLDLSFMVKWVAGFSSFAFILTLAREIIKDAEDIKGDRTYGRRTLPVIIGIGASRGIVITLFALTCVSLILVYFLFLPDSFTLIYIIAFIIIPLTIAVILTAKAKTSAQFHTASMLTKWIMVAGLLYALVANYLIHHLK